MLHNLLKIQKKADETFNKAKTLQQRTEQMSRIYTNLANNFTDGRTKRHTRKIRESRSKVHENT